MCEKNINLDHLTRENEVTDFDKLKKGNYYYGFRGNLEQNEDGITFHVRRDDPIFRFFCGKFIEKKDDLFIFFSVPNSSRSSNSSKSDAKRFRKKIHIRPHYIFDLHTKLATSTKKRMGEILQKRRNTLKMSMNRKLPTEMGKEISKFLGL